MPESVGVIICRVTEFLKVDALCPEPKLIARAAGIIRGGGLVAFPTETVYGLGADGLSAAAVVRVFSAKGRPSGNPLIVHVADAAGARRLVTEWPPTADLLAARFWPGPLTMVLNATSAIPREVTAGGTTVALRMPDHPVALALIRAVGGPLVAPSANASSQLSPTRAEHVMRSLDWRIEMVLDAGPTRHGIESTVIDLTTTPPRLLRPGAISPEQIRAAIGNIELAAEKSSSDQVLRSPGLLTRHYAPRATVVCVSGDATAEISKFIAAGLRVGWLSLTAWPSSAPDGVRHMVMPTEPASYAARFYEVLHEMDQAGVDRIVVELPPREEAWLAIHDRLARASARE